MAFTEFVNFEMLCSFWLKGNKKWSFFIFVFPEIALLGNEVNRSFHAANLSLTFHLVLHNITNSIRKKYTAVVHLDVGLITFVNLRSKTANCFAISLDDRCIRQILMTFFPLLNFRNLHDAYFILIFLHK